MQTYIMSQLPPAKAGGLHFEIKVAFERLKPLRGVYQNYCQLKLVVFKTFKSFRQWLKPLNLNLL
jgi:hypothetical protein